ncbi:hypothetical protein Ait01nite_068950 [Actinoplanes italicus]|uniref:Uncharacterized protein n=1 Tax=Actinoplanes italicus TaxID=113567 RepID=A0A2T0JY64_9ACTN|nr:hypothetical protein [Actinoplanes italicus]PRX13402.1 hypothetical protein CLV67_125114 [Actinoplanes italicus]GIE33850.1 hypothetical protein Ait01nite_068950 [Actinoplanes italicus]
MKQPRPGLPRFDATVTTANVHERAEQVAVPDFDWMSTPVVAMVDGMLHIDPDAPLPARRRHQIPRPAGAPQTGPVDDAAQSAALLLAGLTRIHH